MAGVALNRKDSCVRAEQTSCAPGCGSAQAGRAANLPIFSFSFSHASLAENLCLEEAAARTEPDTAASAQQL